MKGVRKLLELITGMDQLNEVISASDQQKVLVLKHSTACPISANALKECEQFSLLDEAKDVQIYVVHVIENRPISNEIAERFDIRHESPQALLLKSRKVVWSRSHFQITQDALIEACKEES